MSGGGYSVSPTSTLANAGAFQSVNAPLLNQGTLTNSGTMLSGLVNAGSARQQRTSPAASVANTAGTLGRQRHGIVGNVPTPASSRPATRSAR